MVSRELVREAAVAALESERVRNAMLVEHFRRPGGDVWHNRPYLRPPRPGPMWISFGLGRTGKPGAVIGDIYICPEVARDNAKRQGIPIGEEVLRLVVHGTLHVLGYEHPVGESRTESPMWRRQERILARVL